VPQYNLWGGASALPQAFRPAPETGMVRIKGAFVGRRAEPKLVTGPKPRPTGSMGHWIGFGGRVRIGHGMGLIRVVGAFVVVKVQMDLAVAAVAACAAFFAEMVGARILGAPYTNAGGLFFADTADKRHGCITVTFYSCRRVRRADARESPGSVALRDRRASTAVPCRRPSPEDVFRNGRYRRQPLRLRIR
jgi:hypothetical protein